jgi:hypothetical protein
MVYIVNLLNWFSCHYIQIVFEYDHGSENVANILLDLSTSEIPVMKIEKGINIYTYTYETLINNVNINKSNVL